MKKRRLILIVSIALGLITLLVGSIYQWRGYVIHKQEERKYRSAVSLFKDQKASKALKIIDQVKDRNGHDRINHQWLDLELQCHLSLRNIAGLIHFYKTQTEILLNNEAASIQVARALIHKREWIDFANIIEKWEDRKKRQETWFFLNIDALVFQGHKDKAIEQLKSQKMEGKLEISRLIRLALFHDVTEFEKAWSYLDQAIAIEPHNAEVRTIRATLLERLGKYDVAQVEYGAAVLDGGDNPAYFDNLATFYQKRGNTELALKTWSDCIQKCPTDYVVLKTFFWSRVFQPVNLDWNSITIPSGPYSQIATMLMELPKGTFWFANNNNDLAMGSKRNSNRQELFWLRVLNALQLGQESKALHLLKFASNSGNSYNVDLGINLKRILNFRQNGKFYNDGTGSYNNTKNTGIKHQFFTKLDALALSHPYNQVLPKDIHGLLKSDYAFAACFLAGGWLEAAIQFTPLNKMAGQYPDWFSYGLTQAIRYNRSTDDALKFAFLQKKTPVLKLLISELYLSKNMLNEAMTDLEALAKLNTDVGFRASWLLSLTLLDNNHFASAQEVLHNNRQLRNSVIGKELLARISLAKGNTTEATKQYTDIENISLEASAYLARNAYNQEKWDEAQQFTTALIKQYPGKLKLWSQLETINSKLETVVD